MGEADQTSADQTPVVTGRGYILALLLLLNILLVLDKIVLNTLVEPIRQEFGLSDTQIGAVMGLVYAIFMGIAGLPLGMLADRTNRRNLVAACLAAWSLMTAACGMAQNLTQLILARIGVGIGEAGGGPGALSIIADLFEPKRRARAMAVFGMGTQLAALVNLTIMTQVTHHWGWRVTLFAASVPGILLSLTMLFSMKEPQRGGSDGISARQKAPPLGETLRFIAGQKSLVHLLIGATLSYVIIGGMGSWHFTFLVRSHGLKLHEVGPLLGLSIAVLGVIANLSSGFLSDLFGARDERYRAWLIAGGAAAAVAVGAFSLLASTAFGALASVAAFAAIGTFWFAATAAMIQGLVEVRMRSTLAGLLFLLSNLIGYGLGPMLIGAVSDVLRPQFGEDALRYAMLMVVAVNGWAALHFALAAPSLKRDIEKARGADGRSVEGGRTSDTRRAVPHA